jgi:GNAT superfamily N-acetyltransferase
MREATSATLVALWDWLHDPERPIWGLVACDMNGTPCGLAHYQEILSPLRGTAIGHLDDLFVAPEHRGRDVGRTILDHLRTEARRRNWPIVRWITHTDNVHARALYDHVAGPTDWLLYTMDSTKSETVTT